MSYSGNHSAITTATPNVYISKWGALPLALHAENYVPSGYGLPNKYYRRSVDVPQDQSNIASALNACFSGQTVNVTGSQTVTSDLSVLSGKTLALNNGAIITFSPGKKLTVQSGGWFNANGATLKGNGSPGYWHSLTFNSGGNGSFSNSTIREAQYGIYSSGATVTLSNCTITNNSLYGINSLSSSTLTLSDNTISNNGTGLNLSSSSPWLDGNNISNNTNYGINANNISTSFYWHDNTLQGNGYAMLLNNASPYIYNNFISDNAHGVVITSSVPNFVQPSGQWRGYNAITCAATPLLKAQNYSTVYMGYDFDGGYNSIFGSDLPDMEAVNHSGIYADNNYWGSPNPQVYADGTSWILSRTPLGSDPNPGSECSGSLAASLGKNSNSLINEGDAAVLYWEAIATGRKGDLQKAKELLQLIIEGKYDQKYSPLALLALYKFNLNNKTALSSSLTKIYSRTKEDALRPFAVRLLARESALANNYKDMVAYNTELINNYPNTVNELTALYDLANYYFECEQDLVKANEYYSRMKEAFPDEDLTVFAGINLGILNAGNLKKETFTENIPERYSLSDAYPNPFNPATRIKFSIPKDEFVTLKVYDILGGEILKLVNEVKAAGTYSISFDASNLPSGIYLYQIKAGGFTQTKKMILTK
ncbi:MAG: right-handed parallel beta-helix repeat-containing protein [Ignavibacteriaceae bacterium]|nr:right-handed parallel beta-helix repeat-containing protein [Ignavibacteriaceae bacterium]